MAIAKAGQAAAVAALLGLAVAIAPASAGTPPTPGGCPIFPAYTGPAGAPSAADQTAWNQDVSATPKDARSAEYMKRIRRLSGGQSLHPDFGGGGQYGIPYVVVPQTEPLVDVEIVEGGYPDESEFGAGTGGPGSAPIPLDAPIEGFGDDGDRHVIAVREGACDLWEMYRSFPRPGQERWEADSTALFDLAAADRHPETWTSADAAGLPILPGLVRYDEVAAGSVEHAIRVTFDATRRAYIHPAVHHASSRCGRSLPPMGLRLRMKAGYYSEHLADYAEGSQARPIFEALRRYGMIVADNGSNWFFQGAAHPGWDDEDIGDLKDVPSRAFQAVDSAAGVTTPC
ncbi:MAG: hypothetical protein ACR2G3_01345 [Solirubrobacterales bacterium]